MHIDPGVVLESRAEPARTYGNHTYRIGNAYGHDLYVSDVFASCPKSFLLYEIPKKAGVLGSSFADSTSMCILNVDSF